MFHSEFFVPLFQTASVLFQPVSVRFNIGLSLWNNYLQIRQVGSLSHVSCGCSSRIKMKGSGSTIRPFFMWMKGWKILHIDWKGKYSLPSKTCTAEFLWNTLGRPYGFMYASLKIKFHGKGWGSPRACRIVVSYFPILNFLSSEILIILILSARSESGKI